MTDDATTPVILSAVRTPIGRYLGGLSSYAAPKLGALVIREAVRRAGIQDGAVEEVIMGNVLQGGVGQAPARQAAIHAGLPGTIPSLTINKVCGSGLKAVMLAAQSIKAGDAQCVVAGGMESMSNAPHYVYGMRGGIKVGDQKLVDGMIRDGLWDSFSNTHMGNLAEYTAKKAGVGRQEQDEFALKSHQKAVNAMEACHFKAETLAVEKVEKDEGPRADTSLEALLALKPAFHAKGTVTAGNSSQMSDGAAAAVVMSAERAKTLGIKPLVRYVSFATAGYKPEEMGIGPVFAIPKALKLAGLKLSDIDVIELNEAFAAQALAVIKEGGLDPARVNPNGGAIALGHPLGCTGAKLTATVIRELKRRNGRYGMVTMCVGGGMGAAGIFENVN